MKIPWAIDLKTGEWLRADRAVHQGERGRYRCTDKHCDRELTVARSKRGRQHFKHFRNSGAEGCVFGHHGASVHKPAIRLLSVRFSEAMAGHVPMPLFQFSTPSGPRVVLPFIRACRVFEEWICPISGRRADLALLDSEGKPVLLIEVCYSNAVDVEKRQDLKGYWWIEVEARHVLEDVDALNIRSHGGLPRMLAAVWEEQSLFDSAGIQDVSKEEIG